MWCLMDGGRFNDVDGIAYLRSIPTKKDAMKVNDQIWHGRHV